MAAGERYGAALPLLDDAVEVDELPDDEEDLRELIVRGLASPGLDLTGRRLTDVTFEQCDLAGLVLQSGDLRRVRFVDCRLTGVVAPELRCADVTFERTALVDAWLRMGVLERVDVLECDATGSDLYGATLTRCRILDSKLDGAEITDARLSHVALHGTSLEELRGHAALRGAVIDPSQVLAVSLYAVASAGISIAPLEELD